MKFVPFAVAIAVLAVGTLIEGKMSDRFGQAKSDRLKEFTERLKTVPKQVGDWVGTDDKIDEAEFKASHCDFCISRTYRNRVGQTVNVYLVSGSARHVTIHTPDWCYVGAGYNMVDEPQQYTMENVSDVPKAPEFLTTIFRKEDALRSDHIRIFWGFSDDGVWLGPRMAKPTFSGKTAMYKIYLITQLPNTPGAEKIEGNPSLEFAKEFFPMLDKLLFRGVAPTTATEAGAGEGAAATPEANDLPTDLPGDDDAQAAPADSAEAAAPADSNSAPATDESADLPGSDSSQE